MIYAYVFDQPITESFMRLLARDGRLSYYPDFSRPFFKIIARGGLQLKGIIGQTDVEVVFPPSEIESQKALFESFLRENSAADTEPLPSPET